MTYVIGFGMQGKPKVSMAERPIAREALRLVVALQMSDEEIKFIKKGPIRLRDQPI
jgi:hypothetical protein